MRWFVRAELAIALSFAAGCATILGVDKDYEDIGENPALAGSDAGEGSEVGAEATTGDGGADDGANGADADGGVDIDASLIAPGDVRFVYAQTNGDVSYRVWSHADKTWSAATKIAGYAGFDVPWVLPAIAGSGFEVVGTVASGADGGTLRALAGTNNWTAQITQPNVIAAAREAHRGFDVAFSTVSGDEMVVYADGTPTPKFRLRKNGAFTDEAAVLATAPGLGAVDWVKLVSHPKTDEITLVYTDADLRLYAAVWNGSAWTSTATTLESGTVDIALFDSFSAAYENQSGDLLVLWSAVSACNGPNDNVYYATRANGATTFSARQTATEKLAGFGPVVAASEPGTDRIAFSTIEYSTSCCENSTCNDEGVALWDGSQFGALSLRALDGETVMYAARTGTLPVAVGWLGKTGTAVAVYSNASATGLSWATWTSTNGWALQTTATLTPTTAEQASYAMVSVPPIAPNAAPTDGALVLVILDTDGKAWAKLYDGSTWVDMNNGQPVADNIRANLGVPFGLVTR